MRELVVTEFITLDGVIEAPGGEPTHPHTGWTIDFAGPEQLQYKIDEVLEAEALLLGRVTYEGFAEAWPPRDGPIADKMNAMPKYVASTTLTELGWNNSTLLEGDVPTAVAELKQGDGGPILVAGSAHARAHADRARPRRRVPADGLPGRPRQRQAALPGLAGQADAAARGDESSRPASSCTTTEPGSRRSARTSLLRSVRTVASDQVTILSRRGLIPCSVSFLRPRSPSSSAPRH